MGKRVKLSYLLTILITLFVLTSVCYSEDGQQKASSNLQSHKIEIVESATLDVNKLVAEQKPLISSYGEWLKSQVMASDKSSNNQFNAKIIGGEKTNKFPSVGAILLDGEMHCTGTLIASMTVLTAAHCVYGYDAAHFRFAIGPNAYTATTKYAVTGTKWHENYKRSPSGINDIALLYLGSPPAGLKPMSIPNHNQPLVLTGAQLTFIGYGYSEINQGGDLGKKRQVNIPVTKVDVTTFRYQVSGRNTCNGDSGGPAIYQFPNTQADQSVVVGITSWGDKPCMEFGVDMRVDAYTPWLVKNIR